MNTEKFRQEYERVERVFCYNHSDYTFVMPVERSKKAADALLHSIAGGMFVVSFFVDEVEYWGVVVKLAENKGFYDE